MFAQIGAPLRRLVVIACTLACVLHTVQAQAAEPLRPQMVRCAPNPIADATQGKGNMAAGRRVDVNFRWALGNPADTPAAAKAATTRVELCWTSATVGGLAQCPGQTGDDAWIVYRSSPLLGALPADAEVVAPASPGGAEPSGNFASPIDWDSAPDTGKILFFVVNQEISQGATLLDSAKPALDDGGFCAAPYRVDPSTPGQVTQGERFVVYGVTTDFAHPAGWTSVYPSACSVAAFRGCPTGTCFWDLSVAGGLGPCMQRDSAEFFRDRMWDIDRWQYETVQGALPEPSVRLWNHANGTGVAGSTCTIGQTCPTRSMWIPLTTVGTGANGINWTTSTGFNIVDPQPLSQKVSSPFRNLAHEYFHSLQKKWADRAAGGAVSIGKTFYGHLQFLEGAAQLAQLTTCITNYPSNANGDSVPADKCVSPHTLYYGGTWGSANLVL